jgi:hypothetical protein
MTASPDSIDRIQITELLTPAVSRFAGASLGTAGFFVTGTALALTVEFEGLLHGIATAPVWILGLLALVVGPSLYNARGWAAVLGVAVALTSTAVCLAWAAYALWSLAFVPMVVLGLGSSGVAAVLAPFAVLPSIRVSRTRRVLLS